MSTVPPFPNSRPWAVQLAVFNLSALLGVTFFHFLLSGQTHPRRRKSLRARWTPDQPGRRDEVQGDRSSTTRASGKVHDRPSDVRRGVGLATTIHLRRADCKRKP